MKKILFALLCLLFLGCENEKKDVLNTQNSNEELIVIEQDDEITPISDSNLPLPIEDESMENGENLSFNSSITSTLYKKKCASCHGKKAELKPQGSRALRNLDKQSLIQSLDLLEKNKDKDHILELSKSQIDGLAEFISKAW